MKPLLVTVVLVATAVIPCPLGVAAGGAATSGGKTGPTATMGAKGSIFRQHADVMGVRSGGGFRRFGAVRFDEPSFLIVDAVPAEAQIFLDGRHLGSAADLLALALPLTSGRHTLLVAAPGFKPHVAEFAADPSFSTRLRVALTPE